MRDNILKSIGIILVIFAFSGCTFIFQWGRRSDSRKIAELAQEVNELSRAKQILEERLSKEIQDEQVKLQMQERGLVITVVGDVLFDSGKDKVRKEAFSLLNKVARVLQENVPDLNVGIEGHTDNQPIKHSGWRSNWELSAARALSVLHYLVNEQGLSPMRLSAIGYGEYRPVAPNDTKANKQLNRRVEIVILPKIAKVTKEPGSSAEETSLKEPQENLK